MDHTLHTLPLYAALLGACSLPMLASAVVLAVQSRADRLDPGPQLPQAAGRWLRQLVARRGDDVTVEVHPHAGIDAYWPGTGAIGLSDRTFGSHDATAWAIAAHELGHANTMASSRVAAELLPTARLARTFAFRAFAGSLVCSALFASPWLLVLSAGFLALSIASGAVILVDEGAASRFGLRLLRAESQVPPRAVEVARRSMRGAWWVYGAGLGAELVVAASLPWLAGLLELAAPPVAEGGPWGSAICVLVAFVPALLLRAAHVLHQVLRPEPVRSDFRLFTVMHREAQWEFLAGFGVLLVVLGLHPFVASPLGQLATVLATTTAVGPVGGLMRALVLVPLLMVAWKLGWLQQSDEDLVLVPEARGADAAPALMALYSDPPWYLRVSWLTQAAYVPMLVLLLAGLSGAV